MTGRSDENGVFELSAPKAVFREERPLVSSRSKVIGSLADEGFDGEGHTGAHDARFVVEAMEDIWLCVEHCANAMTHQVLGACEAVALHNVVNGLANLTKRHAWTADGDGFVSRLLCHFNEPLHFLRMSFSYHECLRAISVVSSNVDRDIDVDNVAIDEFLIARNPVT